MSQLCNWVNGAHISIFGLLVLEITFSKRWWRLHLWMVLVECRRVSGIILLTHGFALIWIAVVRLHRNAYVTVSIDEFIIA